MPQSHVLRAASKEILLQIKPHNVPINIGGLCCKTTIVTTTHWKHFQNTLTTCSHMRDITCVMSAI